MHLNKWQVILGIIGLFFVYLFMLNMLPSCNRKTDQQSATDSFVGDQKCQTCHASEHEAWKKSDHYKAMLPASDSTVYGDFNNTTYTADGVTSHFFKKGKEYFINTEGPDGKNYDYKVLYTFGYFPLQQYLVAFPGGRMQVPRVSWDTKEKRWFHQYAHQRISSNDWLHWTQSAQNWNTMCASCHSTNLQKKYNLEQDSFHTTFSSINVSCESCHGPGKLHVDYASSQDYKKGKRTKGSFINLMNSQADQLNTCSPCHALKSDISSQEIASGEFLDNHIPQLPTTEHFFADGQMKDEDYTYTSFLESKMFTRGVKCSNCHNPHSGKVYFSSNQLCLQCHNKSYDDPSHHFHQVNTEGALCKNCHMPGRTYMGNDYRYDHTFRVPRPDLSVEYGTPNACNNCHKNKSYKWAAEAVVKHFGPQRRYHFSEDLIPGSKLDAGSEGHLTKLLKDTATPAIIKATSLYYLGSILTPSSASTLRNYLQSPNADIRFNALRALSNFQLTDWKSAAAPLLSDRVRAVRIAAADMFMGIPVEQIQPEYQQAFESAREENRSYLYNQADFAEGNIMIGDYYLRQNDYLNAQKFYLRAIKKDSLLNYARLNLSVSLSAIGNNQEALKVLKTAAAITPKNDRIYYNLGLLYIEMKDTAEAIKTFEKGINLKSSNPRMYYNYGLLLYEKKQTKKADEVLQKGLAISPHDEDLQNAFKYIHQK
jgi:tetratricopeptide (TPR) repeat protein